MKVSEVGEFGLINILADMAESTRTPVHVSWRQLASGIGDDAAAWRGDAGLQLATTDALIEDVHFSLSTTPWYDLGWKALAVNLSDIAAMGGDPRYALISLALPGDTAVEDVTAFYRGLLALAQPSGVAVIGGDTCRAPLVAITVTVLGNAGDQGPLTRSAAQPGEQVAVTGYVGMAAAGLEMLHQKIKFADTAAQVLRDAFLRPQPRIAEGQALLACGVKAAIDISDGLAADLGHICRQSRVGARIDVEQLPVAPAVRASFGEKAPEFALSDGEDYELLFTASADIIENVKGAVSCPVTVIGEITAGNPGEVTVTDGWGNPVAIGKKGWTHFTSS